jgi:hypothetical protein
MAISTYSGIELRLYLLKPCNLFQLISFHNTSITLLTRLVVLGEGFDDDCSQRAEIFFGHGHCQLYGDVSSSSL